MASKAEAVRPWTQPEMRECLRAPHPPGGPHHLLEMVRQPESRYVRLGDAMVEGTAVISGLGGVLGQIVGHSAPFEGTDHRHVHLTPPPHRCAHRPGTRSSNTHRGDTHRIGQPARVQVDWPAATGVHSQDGMDMHGAPTLVFDHLHVADPIGSGEGPDRHTYRRGHGPARGDHRAPPQLGHPSVPDDGALVVVAVDTQGGADLVIISAMSPPARQTTAVSTASCRAGVAGPVVALSVHGAEARGGEGGEYGWTLSHRLVGSLASSQAGGH